MQIPISEEFKKIELFLSLDGGEIISYTYLCENVFGREDKVYLDIQSQGNIVRFVFNEKIMIIDHKRQPIAAFGINANKRKFIQPHIRIYPEYIQEIINNDKYKLFQFLDIKNTPCFEIVCFDYHVIR